MSELPDDLEDAFDYLDELRSDGSINMFGARPYVARDMGYDEKVAGKVLSAWMSTFDGTSDAATRAATARSTT